MSEGEFDFLAALNALLPMLKKQVNPQQLPCRYSS